MNDNKDFINELSAAASFLPQEGQVIAVIDEAVERMCTQDDRLIAAAKLLERIESERYCIPNKVFGGGDPGELAKSIRDCLKWKDKP